jgi:hypothetical protein
MRRVRADLRWGIARRVCNVEGWRTKMGLRCATRRVGGSRDRLGVGVGGRQWLGRE